MDSQTQTAQKHLLSPHRLAGFVPRLTRLLWPGWITGPIFDKELRVSSRRRRNYVLRFVYLALLTMFVALIWMDTVGSLGRWDSAHRVYRMAEAGEQIVGVIVWFQFCAAQLIAVIILSTAISDEIYNRTLGVLMTTPINSFQIVMGKLFSKLWQILILLAVSLPLLAIVRVFGGVPWQFVIAGLCVTFTAVVFAASVSMFFSIRHRQAYGVILRTLFTGGVLYVFVPLLAILIHQKMPWSRSSTRALENIIAHVNPFLFMIELTDDLFSPARAGTRVFSFWLHCGVMLAASVVVLTLTIRMVRKVSLRQATGQAGIFPRAARKWKRKAAADSYAGLPDDAPLGKIRPVYGDPIVWKELKTPLLRGGGRLRSIIGISITLLALFATYYYSSEFLDEGETHIIYTTIFMLMGMIGTAVLSATAITSEKESRSWPILLATTLTDWQIIRGKAYGTFRRYLPVWVFLIGHLTLFVFVGFIHWVVLLHAAILVTWIIVFFTGAGLYFSSRFKKTTTAVVMNIALGLAIWLVIPFMLAMISEIHSHSAFDDDPSEISLDINPVIQTFVIIEGAAGRDKAKRPASRLNYDWPFIYRDKHFRETFDGTTLVLLATMLGYSFVGFLLAWLAKARLRRNIF